MPNDTLAVLHDDINNFSTYGYEPTKMANNMTVEQLEKLLHFLRDDPANRAKKPGIHLFNKQTYKRIDNVTWAIFQKTKALGES